MRARLAPRHSQLTRLIDGLLDLIRISNTKIRLQATNVDLRDIVLRTVEELGTASMRLGCRVSREQTFSR